MRKKWKRGKNKIMAALIGLSALILPFNEVYAGDTSLGIVRFGDKGITSTSWVYSGKARFSHSPTVAIAPDTMYENSSNGTHWFTLETLNSDYTQTFNTQQTVSIKLPSTLGGNLEDNIDSVVWSLTSSLDYGLEIEGSSALTGSTYCTSYADIESISVVIAGHEYILNFQSGDDKYASAFHDGAASTYVNSPTYNIDLGSYIPFDLNNLMFVNQWDVTLKVTLNVNVTVTSYDFLSDYYVRTWFKWNLGSADESPLVFYIFQDSLNKSLGELTVLLESLHDSSVVTNLKLEILQSKVYSIKELLENAYTQSESDKTTMDNFQSNSSSQSSQLGELNEQNEVDKIDIDSASSTVDSNINLDAVGSSGVVLSALTGQNKILTMLLGVTAISLIAYVFFGKR